MNEHHHDGGHSDHAARFRDPFWWSLAATIPTLIWGENVQNWLGYTAPAFPGSTCVPPAFGTAVMVHSGRVFLADAVADELGIDTVFARVTADVGIAIGAGTGVAVGAGNMVLVRSDPRDIPRILALSRATYRKMIQNLWWAAGYNIVTLPLAAGAAYAWGILLHPAVNAQMLRRTKL